MKRWLMFTLLEATFMLLLCATLWAQIPTTRLEGTVEDVSGNAITGAVITATQDAMPWKTQAVSDDDGYYVFPALPLGIYTLSVEAKGFRPVMHTRVGLNVPGSGTENFVLQRGSSKESATQEAVRERLQNSQAEISGAFTRRDLERLPQLNRAPIALSVYQPGIQILPGDTSYSHVNGTRQGSNNISLDGVDANDAVDPRLGLSLVANNTDSIEQFSVITNGGKAEYGRNAGAQVMLATRAGGSSWHGGAFDYLQNKFFNANDFFNNASNIEKPRLNRNIFGLSFGGPLLKDRTFIFANFQGRRTAQAIVANRTVLTPEAKVGLFRWTLPGSSTTGSYDIVKNDPRKLGIDSKVASILTQLPDPNNSDIGDGLNTGGFRFNNPTRNDEDQATIRADHNLGKDHHFFFRASWARSNAVDVANGAEASYPGQTQGTNEGRGWGLSSGWDWMINPGLANQLRAGYQRARLSLDRPARVAQPMLLSNSWTDPLNPSFSRWRNSPVTEVADNLTLIRGDHAFKTGFTFRLTSQHANNEAGIYPNVTFGRANGDIPSISIGPSGNQISQSGRQQFENLYNDLLGRVESVTQTFYGDLSTYLPAGTARARTFLFHDYGVFVQDDWALRTNLTLNLGVRYELGSVPSESNGIQGMLDKANAITSSANISNFTVQHGGQWYKQDVNNFAPRAGFAWAPFNSAKMILRGGYGIFYERLAGQTTNFVDNYTPASAQIISLFPNAGGTDRRLGDGIPLPTRPDAVVLTLPATRSTTAALFKPDLQTGFVRHFHLTLQRRLPANTIIEAGYVGQRGDDLLMNLNLNQLRVAGDFLQSFKELQRFRLNGTPVPSTNTLVRIFGSVNAAVSAIGGSALDQGLAGSAAETVDRNYFARYAPAGVSDFYLRNYPQYNQLIVATNDGRSSYDSLQIRARMTTSSLKVSANYTWSKSLDNISADCAACALPMDSFNPQFTKAPSDYDRPRVFNAWGYYDLPFGPGRQFKADTTGFMSFLISHWTIGALTVWENGSRFSVSSGLQTARSGINSLANYTGSRQIGSVIRKSDGVYWFSADQIQTFTLAAAGEVGTSGRNSFLGPNYFNTDISVMKGFRLRGESRLTLRAEIYNILNRAHFGQLNTNLSDPAAFGKFSATDGYPRLVQLALRYDF